MARIGDVMNLRLVSVKPDEPVQVAIARMLEENVGSVAVCDGSRLVGIFTERDVLRLAGQDGGFHDTQVGDVMTRTLVTITPEDDVVAAAQLMGERRIRHLPVVQGDNILGLIGIRDVLRVLVETLWRERDEGVHETARGLLRGG
ncbi:MAG: CBS domain-containing protein [Gaiellaceae bacterium]